MGLFEDIERAWFVVENKLFLWDYADGYVVYVQLVLRAASSLAVATLAVTTSNPKTFSPSR